jgi:cAMP phosphodiesterase
VGLFRYISHIFSRRLFGIYDAVDVSVKQHIKYFNWGIYPELQGAESSPIFIYFKIFIPKREQVSASTTTKSTRVLSREAPAKTRRNNRQQP